MGCPAWDAHLERASAMSLRIPLTRDQTLQTEFHEIERRLRKLEKRTGLEAGGASRVTVLGSSGAGSVNLTPILQRIEALEDLVATLPTEIYQDFGGVGATSNHGLVPAPGTSQPPTGVGQHLLTESGTWGFPHRGLTHVVTPGDENSGSDTVNVLGNLTALGTISAYSVEANGLQVIGTINGEVYVPTDLRGLIQVATDPTRPEDLPDDKINILGDLHVHDVSAVDIECKNLAVYGTAAIVGTIDGGVP